MSGGRLRADPLFQGLARPTMIMGVSFMYFVANAMTGAIFFIQMKSFLCIPLAGVIHIFGYLICAKEPRAMELWILKMRCGSQNLYNRPYHSNTNSYDVF